MRKNSLGWFILWGYLRFLLSLFSFRLVLSVSCGICSNFQVFTGWRRCCLINICLVVVYFCLQTASSLACAQKGWVSIDLDKIQCEYCGSSLHYSPPQHQLNHPQGQFLYCYQTELLFLSNCSRILINNQLLPMKKSFCLGRSLCRCDFFSQVRKIIRHEICSFALYAVNVWYSLSSFW